ncbi:Long-chain-fatty-acid--CoA ligase ACSBG2 [Merluccius polli]|uniref:Long-chain-fatty-acid--CoA ligase ACSBG2 n=1 Tax=Merluccius polli TaxID=89951 RepID=A0AA47MVW5_MERPO|nr:Long-chain-fatty-acid--CoA ligase ACSBG2 [Merluccius polli]
MSAAAAAAAAMDPAGQAGLLQSSCKAEDSAASLEDVTTDTANESSEEESAGEREEQIRDDKDIVITTSNTQRASARRPDSLSVVAAAAAAAAGAAGGSSDLWTHQRDGEVKLRMGDSGMAAEAPLTTNQMFTSAVERFPDVAALSWKDGEQRRTLSYREYYQQCRNAAKSFLKVRLHVPPPCRPSFLACPLPCRPSFLACPLPCSPSFLACPPPCRPSFLACPPHCSPSFLACPLPADQASSHLGLERYRGVGILGFNSAEWFIADVGAILAGGFAVGIYTTNSAEACHYVAENCEANIIVVENNKQLQKILQVQDQLPHLKAIVQYKDELKEKKKNVYTWAEFMDLGRDEPDAQLDEVIASQRPNQCCTLIYTSGTTGPPKGVMLSHDNVSRAAAAAAAAGTAAGSFAGSGFGREFVLTWTAGATCRHVGLTDATLTQEAVVSYLPLSHIAAQMVDLWVPMKVGGTTHFAQPDALKGSLVNTLKEVRPTAFMGVPRVWEKMQEKMRSVGAKSSTMKRKVASWAKDVGLQTNLRKMNQNGAAGRSSLNYRLAKRLVFTKVRKALGLDRCRRCYTGAAPITKDTLEFFLSLDVPLYELYGMSENSGPHTISLPDAFRLTSCGKEIEGCMTKIHNPDDEGNGEICFWGRHLFMGYLNQPVKTAESLDADGWLRSGDLGKHDESNFLFITGRIKELIITAGGENIPPVPIEDAVKETVPLVSNAMLIGDKRKFLSMLLTIKCQVNEETGAPTDELTDEAVAACRKLGCSATRVSEVCGGRDRAVHAAIQEGINRVNERATSNAQRVQKWFLLDRDFSIGGGELGPTMKLRRPVVMKMYKEQIDSFYKEVATPGTPDNPLPK